MSEGNRIWYKFQPTFQGSTAAGSPAYTTQSGYFLCDGRNCQLVLKLVLTAVTSCTGRAQVILPSRVPMPMAKSLDFPCSLVAQNVAVPMIAKLTAGSRIIDLYIPNNNSTLTNSDASTFTTAIIEIACDYIAASH